MKDLTLKQVERKLQKVRKAYDVKWHEKTERTWEEFVKYAEPEIKQMAELSRQKRMMMPYKMKEIPDYGDVMSLEDFLGCVKEGGFIDYDGYGHYAKDGMMSDVCIFPSDVKHGSIRKEFDTVVWFNR